MDMQSERDFELFMSQLYETNATLDYYCDFAKVVKSVDNISISLNTLNYLIGQSDMDNAVRALWTRDSSVFNVLDILIAVRRKDHKKFINSIGRTMPIESLFQSSDGVIKFLNDTGLTEVFQHRQITNLVDYVFGVEVGLDTNARKNRGGDIMEGLIHNLLLSNDIPHSKEVESKCFPAVEQALGSDKKRFDFVVKTLRKTYLIEVNFYSGGGSKLNEIARSYSDIAPKISRLTDFEFVWITDGVGWNNARNKLQEAYSIIPNIYNLANINNFFNLLKSEGFGNK
ncbi:MAG: type II restriction endonuclease [Tidjanibacter sp.]|nr:type II restriction endonuclease [Tidjanibacter sp.]